MAFTAGVGSQVNPVETLYSAFPAFMYIDPGLEPSYLDVSISNSLHGQESRNTLIMTYVHARASGDTSLIPRYTVRSADFLDRLLVKLGAIHPRYSADGLSTDSQTNPAIKGIIAIKVMSQMSSFINKTIDFDEYSVRADVAWRNRSIDEIRRHAFTHNVRTLHRQMIDTYLEHTDI
ncbi:hypothetical protein EDB92DRAFT_13728 [Lactarius akahatsu]|uniref:Glutaminase A central domain-containing protein n=1 Tax=Lactarius akahatsu TaxID=416441 RepID=A0AAD4QHV7_9AGAM|nr:hypothetical protein EDB92DRAFT_13728 [Lactarius akahatsu]